MTEMIELEDVLKEPLGRAESLPFSSFTSDETYRVEQAKIFHGDWIFICAEKELAENNDYFVVDLAGESIAIIRGADGQLRALSNLCRHRGTPILDNGFGNTKRFTCPYHAWTYNDQGELKGIPLSGNVEIDKQAHCLPRFNLEVWQGLVFINLSDNPSSLSERLAGLEKYFRAYHAERFQQSTSGEIHQWQANWKLAVENGIESYHLFKVHKETLETVTPTKQAFYLEGSASWTVTAGKMKDAGSTLWNWLSTSDSPVYGHYILVSVPPSLIGIMTYDSFEWISVLPAGPESCVVRSAGIAESSKKENQQTTDFVSAFFEEDKQICERVQRGMSSMHGRGGRLVELERIVVDFHHYLGNRLFGHPIQTAFQSEDVAGFCPEENT